MEQRRRAAAVAGTGPEEAWYDHDAGPVVRSYVMTRGRTRSGREQLDLISLVVTRPSVPVRADRASPEQNEIIERCRVPLSVAEVSAALNLPLGIVRVLIGDLLQAGMVETWEPYPAPSPPSESVLEAVLAGLRAL